MIDIKLSVSFLVPGTKMYTQQECCRYSEKKGEFVEDSTKMNAHNIVVEEAIRNSKGKIIKKVKSNVSFRTRKVKPVQQVMNLSRDAFMYFISDEVPEKFTLGGDDTKIRQIIQAWKRMSKSDKIMWHLNQIANDLHAKVLSYQILED